MTTNYNPESVHTHAYGLQMQAFELFDKEFYQPPQIAAVLGCSVHRVTKLRNQKAQMTVIELARVLDQMSVRWPEITELQRVGEPRPAPGGEVSKPRKRLDMNARGVQKLEPLANDMVLSAISTIRAKLMAQVPLPAPYNDPAHAALPIEQRAVARLEGQRRMLANRLPEDMAIEDQQKALCAYCGKLSGAIAAAMLREFGGAEAFKLEQYYEQNPDALTTPYDMVVRSGGRYDVPCALELHQAAVAQTV